jgi:ribosome-associated protein
MLRINNNISIPDREIEISAIRAQGAGGQNVNKVSSAIHLRFNIHDSSLNDDIKIKILDTRDKRINKDGIVVIKAQRCRDQEKNKIDALDRLANLIRKALTRHKKRIATRPGKKARQRRMDRKSHQGKIKKLRQRPAED